METQYNARIGAWRTFNGTGTGSGPGTGCSHVEVCKIKKLISATVPLFYHLNCLQLSQSIHLHQTHQFYQPPSPAHISLQLLSIFMLL